ncbi:uncharacterized protein dec [Calliphora vicina]|uniref:uncharacterized protein dec n=1 Tax=Calliphora vicina TaxID=7373 RepID=UPI00325B1FD8
MQAPLVGNPFDNQASSPTNNVLLVLNNDKNKLADLARPAEESLKRLTRNPDVMDDIVGQFQQLGGGVTQQLLQQVTQTAPEMSRSFGQALNEALSQTSLLAQAAPGNIDLTQLAQTLSQSNLPGNIDFGQLGQSLSQSFIVGAAQNLLNPAGAAQAAPEAAAAAAEEAAADAEADPEVGAAAEAEPEPEPEPEAAAESEAPAAPAQPKNPFDQIVGSALLPQLPQLSQLNLGLPPQLPLGLLSPLAGLNPFMPLGSEISEVRVMPDQYSPYKISPRPVDHQTLAEMKLKAVLKEALTKKTIPILWFHLSSNHHLQKTTEDLEIEAKLEIFEKQVIEELKQLQELSKLANDVKRTQLGNGAQPTASLTTKLNLYEIPVYEITLGDIEKTLKDEHVIILMHTIMQNQNKQFHRHHQATTKYLTDLTGTPIKRQTKTAEDALKTMEKDDMMKMMTYAYRMAAMNGHEMPWLKNEKIMGLNEKDASKTTMTSQQRQSADGNMPMTAERQWLEEKQRQMAEERRQKMDQNQFRQWADPNMQQLPQQQPIERQWANPNMMQQQQMPIQRQMLPPQMQQQMPIQRQMIPPQMLPPFPIQNQMIDPNMQWQPQDIQRQMMPQPMMSNFDRPPQMPMQRQWGLDPATMQQQQQPMMQRQMTNPMMQQTQFADPNMQPMQRQWADSNMPETKAAVKTDQQPEQRQAAEAKMPEQQSEQRKWAEQKASDPTGALKKTDQQPEQRQWIDTKTNEKTAAKTDANMSRKNERLDNMPVVGESKPQMAENAGKGRHKGNLFGVFRHNFNHFNTDSFHHKTRSGMEDLFDELDVFDHGKHKGKEAAKAPPTIINYYYSTGGSSYPPVYAPAGSYQSAPPAAPQSYGPPPAAQSYAPAGGYARPPPPPSYAAAPQYKPGAGHYGGAAYGSNAYGSHGGYRSATGDDEIAVMLQQNQPMPKMMMMMPHDEEPAPPTITTSNTATATENDINNAEHPNINHSKRLAKTKNTETNLNPAPAAYIVVIKNSTSKSGSRSRRKRSTEYATLEPIDENSLDALRKTYKNSLKEITLNPNETPAEALMRYNAESIREALQKANQQPMEISAGGEHEEHKQGQLVNEVAMKQQQGQQLPQGYALGNDQYMPVSAGPQSQINNGPYITLPVPIQQAAQPLSVAYNQQQSAYDTSPNQGAFYNNFITKYNTPAVYSSNSKMITQNPFLSMYNSLESVPYIDDYSVSNQQYQQANHNIVNNAGKASKSIVYQKSYTQPQLTYNHLNTPATKSSNMINKNVQHIYTSGHHQIKDYGKAPYGNYATELPPTKNPFSFSNNINKNGHISSYSPARQPNIELTNHYKYERAQESSSFENLMAVIKERLAQCCNECKDNILKGLDETLKRKHYGSGDKLKILEINVKPYATITEKPHILTYRKPSREEDFEYKQWLTEMSEKGYDRTYLTKQHQREYLKDGKLHLHMADESSYGPGEEKIFYKNNQSYKRETTVPETDIQTETEPELVTDPIVVENKIEKIEQEEDEVEEEEEEDEAEPEPEEEEVVETVSEPDKETPIVIKEENSNKKIEKETETKQVQDKNETKVIVKKEKPQNLNTTKAMETAESTTHSVYALRGQFRSNKRNPMQFALKQGKQFHNYKNINKLGSAGNTITKSNGKTNSIDKNDKLEEILDILHDLSKHTKDKTKETSKEESSKATPAIDNTTKPANATTPSPTSSTNRPLTTASTVTANGISIPVEKPKKLSRRRARLSSKSRKLKHTASNQTLSSLPSPTSTSSSTITISSLSPSTSSSPESSNNSDSGPEVGSLFSFEPHLLEPFMGLHSVDHADDPWHHKAYNPYQPIFTGGGTFEEYIKSGRYKRDLTGSPASTTFSKTRNVLTPDMLERLLRIKSSFQKNYPVLYKSMMGQLTNGKSTTITVTPPEVPQHVSYRNVELAAAEINPLETLIDTYQEDLQNILAAQRQKQQQREFHDPLIKPYTNEFNFWGNSHEVVTSNTPQEETHIFPQTPQQLALNSHNEELSFWENPQETLKTAEEESTLLASPEKPALNEPQSYWENSQETLNTLTEAQKFLEQPQENINDHSIIKHNSQESVNEPQSYWENSEETLKTLSEQPAFLDKSQVTSAIEQQNFWETPEEIVSDVHKLPQETLSSVNEEEEFWENSPQLTPDTSVVQKRSSFWDELEAEEHENEREQHNSDDSEPIFDFDEDFD